jgi:hypothetical protein
LLSIGFAIGSVVIGLIVGFVLVLLGALSGAGR